MTFEKLWKEMKGRNLLKGAKKAELKSAYDFRKQIEDIKIECEQRVDAIHEEEKKSKLYTLFGPTYCSMLEIIYQRELK